VTFVRRLRLAVLVVLAAGVSSGCVSSILARKIVAPPNRSGIVPLFADSPVVKRGPDAYAQTWKLARPSPPATISIATVEPGDYAFRYDLDVRFPPGKDAVIRHLEASWRPAAERVRPTTPPRGTIVLLHGYLLDRRYVVPWAITFAQAGYRCALVDLRGHGESTGRHIGFGAFEAADVGAVIDSLRDRGWDVSRVGLFGVSYGASVAMLAAGRDPRVRAVVALEPFASAERAVPELMRTVFAGEARGISDAQFALAHVKEAKIAGFDWRDADVPAALARTTAPVLFVHGAADRWIPAEHSRQLVKVAPRGSELEIRPEDDHVTLPLQVPALRDRVLRWFEPLSSP